MTNFAITAATAADVDAIVAIMEEAHRAMADPSRYITDDAAYVARHIEQEGFVLLARPGDADAPPVAFLMVHFPAATAENNLGRYLEPPQRTQVAHMDSAAVLPAWQGHGLQKALLLAAEPRLAAEGYTTLCATVSPDNAPSLHTLQRCGYRVAATVEKYGGLLRHVMVRSR
jgi:ribosomal protein S18 acetylase RimI-like enzyme